ncbi:MAG: GDSL-type esterase/lipase family protein [Nitrospira sp.]|nr:GDSL-type esterase/lipase family protein [Nitrospira sp.]
MKKIRVAIVVISIGLIAIALVIAYERYFVQRQFGPSSLVGVLLPLVLALTLAVTQFLLGTRWQEVVIRAWLTVLSIVFTFIVGDLITGVFLIKPLSPMLVPDPVRHHRLIPNSYSRFEQPEFSYIQRVNNLGFRGKDTSFKKQPNQYRILMLGDSFTMGKGVEDDQTFSALLEASLNRRVDCKPTTFEVLNGGVDSYTPLLSYLQLAGDLMPLEIDLVLLNLDVSDLLQEEVYRKEAVRDQNGEIVRVPGRERPVLLSERVRFWIDQHMFFTRLLLFHLNRRLGYKDFTIQGMVARANPELVAYTLEGDLVDRQEQWLNIFQSINKISKLAATKSADFALVVYPWGHQVNDSEWVPGRFNWMAQGALASDKYLETIDRLSKLHGIVVINLFSAFRAYRGDAALYFKHDPHWTVEGHRLMASQLEQQLMEKFLSTHCKTAM